MKQYRAVSAVRGRRAGSAWCRRPVRWLVTRPRAPSGLDRALSTALAPWRKPRAVHDPGKIILDLALALALGGDCLADVAMLRAEPGVFGPVASDPTVSRLIDTLAADAPRGADGDPRPRGPPRGSGPGSWPVTPRRARRLPTVR